MPPRRRPPRPGALTDLPPLKIVRKIVLLQLLYYVSATVLILFTTLVAGTVFSVDLIFSWDSLRGDTTVGWMLSLVWMLNSFLCVIFLLIIVSRSKLVPDFALTLHFIHFVIVSFYTHTIPANWLWWGLQLSSAALMTFGGIWACQRRELQPITFGLGGRSSTTTGGTAANSAVSQSGGDGSPSSQPNADMNDPESGKQIPGISRGRGRGRNRDGGGDYEMVLMKDVEEEAV